MCLVVGAGCDAAGLLEGLGEMALVEEARLHGDVRKLELGFLQQLLGLVDAGRNRLDLFRPQMHTRSDGVRWCYPLLLKSLQWNHQLAAAVGLSDNIVFL